MSSGSSSGAKTTVTLTEESPSSGSPTVSTTPSPPSLIELAIASGPATASQPDRARLDDFLKALTVGESLRHWLGDGHPRLRNPERDQIARLLNRDIARIDALLTDQVNAILHHTSFQQLEASWRGLSYLVQQGEGVENLKIRVLNVSWKELTRDLDRAIEFDQSQLFKKVYSEEFDTPGGEPFSVLLGDYQIQHRIGPDHPMDDIAAMQAISQVAAAAFAPFIASSSPALFGLDSFTEMERPMDLGRSFEQLEYLKWRAFRDSEDSRFVGLTLPKTLMRLPYDDTSGRIDGFRFQEDVESPDRSKYLWGNAIYAFGAVLIRAFAESGWLADIRGVQRGIAGGGLVTGLPVHSFNTDAMGVALKVPPTPS
ncbi:MAG: type VI secretion system contractile sheath large subunit [Planctomycetota bacterium]